jgi:hypothetical protein
MVVWKKYGLYATAQLLADIYKIFNRPTSSQNRTNKAKRTLTHSGANAIESHAFPRYGHFSFDNEEKDQGSTVQQLPGDNLQDQMDME